MRSTKQARKGTTPQTLRPVKSKSLIRSEWPLLLYPVLVLAALGALYVANRPVLHDRSSLSGTQPDNQKQRMDSGQPNGARDEGRTSTNPVAPKPEEARGASPDVKDEQQAMANGTGQVSPTPVIHPPSGVSPAGSEPPGPGRLVGLLRRATQTNNQAALKDCLDQLVALGDQSIATLSDLVARGGADASCVWAAEALARIGTPAATQSLLDTLSQMKDGSYKEQIAKRASNISNHDSWPALLDAMQTTDDAVVRRAASTSLSRMADAPIVDELVARYDAAATTDEAANLASVVSSINSSKASESLLALAKEIPSVPEDPLERSILDAIANVGDPQCVSFLLRRLESCPPGGNAYLTGLIGKINQPQAQASLLYAAGGNKEVSAEQGRTAAILALKNFPSEQTYVLLEQIASTEQNAAVASAAVRTLAGIQRAQPMLAANAQVRPGEQILLPVNSLQKRK